jgi:hypothetical protein
MKRIFAFFFIILLCFQNAEAQDKSDSLDAGGSLGNLFKNKPKKEQKPDPKKAQKQAPQKEKKQESTTEKNSTSSKNDYQILILEETNQKPISNCQLTIHFLEDSTDLIPVKDSSGLFAVELIPNQKYLIQIKKNGFEPFETTIAPNKNPETFTFKLKLLPKLIQTPDNNSTDNQKLKNLNNILIIAIGLMFLALLLSMWMYYFKTTNEMKPSGNEDTNEDLPLENKVDENVVENEIITTKDNDIIPIEIHKKSYFISEVLMTAGPRKKFMNEPNSDVDLGEDVCGIITKNNEILMWLLDGTSDLHCLRNPETNKEYFSSRLLAQSVAENLRKYFCENEIVDLEKIVNDAIDKVKVAWLKNIHQLHKSEKSIISNNILDKNFPECASTLLIAHFSISGKLTVYRSGDSKLLPFSTEDGLNLNFLNNSLSTKNEDANDRIFFRLVLDKKNNIEILSNKPNHEVVIDENIKAFIAFSDGISGNSEQILKEHYADNPEQTRDEIIHEIQSTADDKSICFIRIQN